MMNPVKCAGFGIAGLVKILQSQHLLYKIPKEMTFENVFCVEF